jgi:hypothetical protein
VQNACPKTKRGGRKGKEMTVKEILIEYLKEKGFTGLCSESCGCTLDDLAPCGEFYLDCQPGYRRDCPKGEDLSACDLVMEDGSCFCAEGRFDGCTSTIKPPAKSEEGQSLRTTSASPKPCAHLSCGIKISLGPVDCENCTMRTASGEPGAL